MNHREVVFWSAVLMAVGAALILLAGWRGGGPPPDDDGPHPALLAAFSRLSALAPTALPADLYLDRDEALLEDGRLGWAALNAELGRWEIHVDAGLSPDLSVQVLIHEWAHALAPPGAGHGDEWGLAYGRAYRAWRMRPVAVWPGVR